MAVRERYQYVVDLVVDNANRSLGAFKANADAAESSTGRLRGTLTQAGDFLRTHMAEAALAAGAALVTFGQQSVRAFQDAALEAGKFSEATGLSVEDAARWIEVADDVGVSAETVSGLFVRLNKAVGDNSPVIKQLGIEMQTTKDGTADVNATMLDAIQRLNEIEDPGKRAAAAQRLFGRNYAEAAEIIFSSAPQLRGQLEGVSDALVIDQDELRKAREMRAAFDELGDAVKEVQLLLGEQLAPRITNTVELFKDVRSAIDSIPLAAEGLGAVVEATEAMWSPVTFLTGAYKDTKEAVDDLIPSEAELTENIFASTQAAVDAAVASGEFGDEVDVAGQYAEVAAAKIEALTQKQEAEERQARDNIETVKRLTTEYNTQRQRIDDLIGRKTALVGGDIAVRDAQRQARDAAVELNTALEDQDLDLGEVGAALDEATGKQLAAAQAAADFRADQMEANGTLVDAKVKNQLMKEELIRLAEQLDGPLRDAILAYIEQLNSIPRSVNTVVTANGTPGSVPIVPGSRYASGTKSAKAGVALVGEEGPELVMLNGGERIYDAQETGDILGNQSASATLAMGAGGGSGPTYVLQVMPGAIQLNNSNASGDDVVRSLESFVRRGGFIPPDVRRKFSA